MNPKNSDTINDNSRTPEDDIALIDEIEKLREWQTKTRTRRPPKGGLNRAVVYIRSIAASTKLPPELMSLAEDIVTLVFEKGIAAGRSVKVIAGAVTYVACRLLQTPRSLSELAHHVDIELGSLSHCYRLILVELDLKIPVPNPLDYVFRICEVLELPDEIQEKSKEIIQEAEKKGLVAGKDPWSISGGAIYLASILTGHRVSQKALALAADISEVTVRNRYKDLRTNLSIQM
jgi:transcription initiation factor TFIIB